MPKIRNIIDILCHWATKHAHPQMDDKQNDSYDNDSGKFLAYVQLIEDVPFDDDLIDVQVAHPQRRLH